MIRKGSKTRSTYITPSCVSGIVLDFIGPVAAKYLKRFWCDLGTDVVMLNEQVADMQTWMPALTSLPKFTSYTRHFRWVCRPSGTHLYDIHNDNGTLAYIDRTEGGRQHAHVDFTLECHVSTSDATGYEFTVTAEITRVPRKDAGTAAAA